MRIRALFLTLILSCVLYAPEVEASRSNRVNEAYVDKRGVVRWSQTGDEVCAMGVNYNTPFSYWESRKPIGADQYQAIDEDVYHLSRLGIDGFRIHVWDCYISDEEGNLVDNEHLRLYDYMHYRFKQRGVKLYITPINLFTDNNGGFATAFGGKSGCCSNPEAFPIMAHYLQEFMNHVNPYTGIAYKDDPDIVALELINEPSHWSNPDVVTDLINMLYDAIRETGCGKPIFYNMTSSSDFIDRVLASKVDGGSFQWYPTGLTSNFDLGGNFLPYVDQYNIPFAEQLKRRNIPKFIYEFSPADVGNSAAMYPAMARSFREAGFQFVAKFCYDQLHSAYSNIEYKTHFLNMVYTPQKSMGMMIAAEVFREIPLYKSFGRYPENNTFGSCRLDPLAQSAEFISESKYLHTHASQSAPKDLSKLEKIAGVGDSPMVKYSGTGIYILDKIEDGVWRLELMPDAFVVSDPFFSPTLEKEVAVSICREQSLSIELPNLGDDFRIVGLNEGNRVATCASGADFRAEPGVYLLSRKGVTTDLTANSSWQTITLGEYHIPQREMSRSYVLNHTATESIVAERKVVEVSVIAPQRAERVVLKLVKAGVGFESIEMNPIDEYRYEVELPDEIVAKESIVKYYIEIQDSEGLYSYYPSDSSNRSVNPIRTYSDDVKLVDRAYQLSIVGRSQPIYLFDSNMDYEHIMKLHRKDVLSFSPSERLGGRILNLYPKSRFKGESNVVSYYCRERVEARSSDIDEARFIEVLGKAEGESSSMLNITLIMRDGSSYGAAVEVGAQSGGYRLPLSELKVASYAMHPLPYPYFNIPFSSVDNMSEFDIREVEKVIFGVVADGSERSKIPNIGVESIRLVK